MWLFPHSSLPPQWQQQSRGDISSPTVPLLRHDQGPFLPFAIRCISMAAFFLKIKQTFDFFAANGPFRCAYMCPSPPVPWNWIFVPGCTSPSHRGACWGGAERKFCRIKKCEIRPCCFLFLSHTGLPVPEVIWECRYVQDSSSHC